LLKSDLNTGRWAPGNGSDRLAVDD
jgi:hypothetical protein